MSSLRTYIVTRADHGLVVSFRSARTVWLHILAFYFGCFPSDFVHISSRRMTGTLVRHPTIPLVCFEFANVPTASTFASP